MVRSLSGVAAWALVLLSCLCADRSDAVAQDLVQRVAQHSRLYLPPGSGPFQTIVAIPGCSGVSFDSPRTDEGRPGREGDRLFRRFYPQMSDRLSQSGFAVLLVDYRSAEEVSNTCSGEIDLSRVAAYIGAALQFAGTLGAIERSRIHLVGWSYGGAGLLHWLGSPDGLDLVNSATAIYPGCGAAEPWETPLPLLMLLAGSDDIAPPQQCESLVSRLPESARVQLHSYPGARHGFDLPEAPPVLELGAGLSLGGSPTAARDAWVRLLAFLSER